MADIFWGENTITHPFYQSAKDLSDISVMKVSFKIVLNLNCEMSGGNTYHGSQCPNSIGNA